MGSRQADNTLEECWPLNPLGPLPALLADRQHLDEAFFKSFPAICKVSGSAVRRSLKHAAKKLGFNHGRFFNESGRDEALAFKFASLPAGREALPSIEVHIQDVRRRGRNGQLTWKFDRGLPEILWSRYLIDSNYAALVSWIESICIDRLLANGETRSFLIATELERALTSDGIPTTLDPVDIARAILIFAGLLDQQEAADLVQVARKLGGAEFGTTDAPDVVPADRKVASFRPDEAAPIRPELFLPKLEAGERYTPIPAPAPELTPKALSILKELDEKCGAAERALDAALNIPRFDIISLVMMSEQDYNFSVSTLQDARTAKMERQTAEDNAKTFFRSQLRDAFAQVGTEVQGDAPYLHADGASLSSAVKMADAIFQFSAGAVEKSVREIWQPTGNRDLSKIYNNFAELPHAQAFLDAGRAREIRFVDQVRSFVTNQHANTTSVATWLAKLGKTELRLLCNEVESAHWPVLAAVLERLSLDADPSAVGAFCRHVCEVTELEQRRDLLYFVDPSAVMFDKSPELQRVIAAERFQDIIAFGPIEAISDPSLRLHSTDLVGSITSDIIEWMVQHLDLFSNGAELRDSFYSPSDFAKGEPKKEAANDLLSFALTPAPSAGFYLILREAIRERYFLPLVRNGEINAKAAMEAAAAFDVDAAIEQAVSDIRKSSNRAARIEARHRARVTSYVRAGKELLDAFVRSQKTVKSQRADAFAFELRRLLGLLNSAEAPTGSREWLELRVKQTIIGLEKAPDLPTLRGDAKPLADRAWTAADTAWGQQSMDLPDFYSHTRLSVADVAAATLRQWAYGRPLSGHEIVDGLFGRQLYGEALSYVEEAFPESDERTALREKALQVAVAAAAPSATRFQNLKDATDPEIFKALPGVSAVKDALNRYDVTAAVEHLDLLELEIQDAIESRTLDALDALRSGEKTLLLTRLLKAGVEGPDDKWLLLDLQKKWTETLNAQLVQRTHLRAVEKALDNHGALPELSDDIEQFTIQALDPAAWLPQERAHDLSEFLEGAADKLRTWGQLAGQLSDPKQRTALVEIIRWFVNFVLEQTSALKALDLAEPTDNLLERVLEVTETIEQAPDPISCASNLGFLGETIQEPVGQPDHSLSSAVAANATILPLIEKGDWTALAQAARSFRTALGDEDGRRMAELAEFAATLSVISEGNPKAAKDGIQIAAKVLTTHGSLVNRALNQAQQLQIAYQLLVSSFDAGGDAVSELSPKLPPDRSWGAIASRKAQFHRVATGTGLANRTLEQLCSGALGREIVHRLWDAPTSTSEPGPFRATLLTFLHEKGLSEHILSLAQRHEPTIKPRLEQLLNLRSIAIQRPDLIPVSEAVAEQIVKAAQGVPFRTFVSGLPTAAKSIDADLIVTVDSDIILRVDRQKNAGLSMAVSIEPRGLVPEHIEAVLFPDDDVSFEDGTRRTKISTTPLYFANQFTVAVKFGPSWNEGAHQKADNFRIRISARVLAGELINRDVVCQLTRADARNRNELRLDNDTLLEAYPGVESTPASGETFVGRHDELETLRNALIGARRPSPVLLTGMRRIGKTSLLYAFHDLHRRPERDAPVTVYFSLAERRGAMMDPGQSVSSVFFAAITQALGKRYFSADDPNRELGEKLKQKFGERDAVRNAILELREPESVADTLTILSEKLLEWMGGAQRIVYLVDEAETLVLPFKGGDVKRLELEQLLQGIREVSQTSTKVGFLLCGSNHIDEFTQSYKEAFFGSSVLIRLSGITATENARRMIAPAKLAPYLHFSGELVGYTIELCAGMPQFLWQLGAATSAIVRSGPVSKADVRQGVAVLVGERLLELPFKTYEVLEPIEHMLGLQGQREQDLYWLLLYRVANSSSLVVDEAQQTFIIDQSLLELDEFEGWKQRLIYLCNLSILEMTRPAIYRFKVPIFAEGFRALRQQQRYLIRHQRAGT